MSAPRCGWAEPADRQNKNGGVTCRRCHGLLRFDLHINQWVHDHSQRGTS